METDKLKKLLNQFEKAIGRLGNALAQEKNEFIRDSAIQRFEFTYELAWKTMKPYLEEKGIGSFYTPKDVIRSAYQAGLIDNNPEWLDMVDTRNRTSHLYNEAMAEKVYALLPKYLPLIEILVNKLA